MQRANKETRPTVEHLAVELYGQKRLCIFASLTVRRSKYRRW